MAGERSIKTLIKLEKTRLDEKQRALGRLLRFEKSLKNRKILLANQFIEEEKVAKIDQVAALTFGAYVDWNINENKRVDKALAETKSEIRVMRIDIRESFREIKTLEIVLENRRKRARMEQERKDNAFLDEVGLNLYRRRQEEDREENGETEDE
ncbi:MAG: hypothetical protein MJ247_01635 [Alphaproteobacteria bacterium]|nr:hypothetical protein [Alphaproteobacteria bacterium]